MFVCLFLLVASFVCDFVWLSIVNMLLAVFVYAVLFYVVCVVCCCLLVLIAFIMCLFVCSSCVLDVCWLSCYCFAVALLVS